MIKLPNFQPVHKKLPELEPRVCHSFDIRIILRKTLLKVLAPPQTHFRSNISVSKFRSVYEISQYFFSLIESFTTDLSILLTISFWPFPLVTVQTEQ